MFHWMHWMLTDEKNQWDIGLLLWIAGFVIYLYRGVTAPWDFQAFGLGLAGVCGAGAGLQWIRTKPTIPPHNEERAQAAETLKEDH